MVDVKVGFGEARRLSERMYRRLNHGRPFNPDQQPQTQSPEDRQKAQEFLDNLVSSAKPNTKPGDTEK